MDNTCNFTGLVQRGDKAINERYRPRTFHEVIGNDATKKSLAGWMERGEKRSKAIMLTGGSGNGKTTMAKILAMGLNCEHGDTVNPCCECPSCRAAMEDEAMHIKYYNMSALSTKDDADAIINSMHDSTFTGRNIVYLMDEIQAISTSSQNLMLTTIENPPPGVYVIFCTTNPEKILKTVKTRCEQYEVRNPSTDDIKQLLGSVVKQEMPSMTLEQRKQILNACQGLGYREILMKLEKFIKGGGTDSIEEAFEVDGAGIAKAVVKGDYAEALKQIAKAGDENLSKDDIEGVKRIIRAFLCNNIKFFMDRGDAEGAKRMLLAFRVFDKGFYTDPKPLSSLKTDIFEACLVIKGMM